MQKFSNDNLYGPSSPAFRACPSSPAVRASPSSPAVRASPSSPTNAPITPRSPAGKRASCSAHQSIDAVDISPAKKLCVPGHATMDARHNAFQQHRLSDEAPQQDDAVHQWQAALGSNSCADQPKHVSVFSNQLHQAARSTNQHSVANDEQLQAAREQYVDALRSAKPGQQQQQQQQSEHAVPDLQRHLHPQRQQLPQHVHQQLQHQHRQHLLKHLQDRNASEEQLPQRLPPQLLEQQQQALAAYQAALGRPILQQTAGPALSQLHAQLPDPAMQHRHAQGIGQQGPAQLPQQVPEQGFRKGHGNATLPCNVAQAHNVYKAFQWQKDAIDYADACNRQAAGLKAHPSEQGQFLDPYTTIGRNKRQSAC